MLHQPETLLKESATNDLSVNLHEHNFPVIKIDFEGTILYANKAALKIIQDWGCSASRKLPVHLLKGHPELLDKNAFAETELSSGNQVVKFNVIAFREAGYTGLYGYEMKMIPA
ncbi:MAG: hypothetical protein NT126_04465 [Bacteroidetes bacterium]|nr:hypothetical protein [Bacteroidota bacterium]